MKQVKFGISTVSPLVAREIFFLSFTAPEVKEITNTTRKGRSLIPAAAWSSFQAPIKIFRYVTRIKIKHCRKYGLIIAPDFRKNCLWITCWNLTSLPFRQQSSGKTFFVDTETFKSSFHQKRSFMIPWIFLIKLSFFERPFSQLKKIF